MKIDQLPVEMLMKIFSYQLRYSEVSQVNKLFCSVARKVNPNITLRLNQKFFERYLGNNDASSQWLQSILTSNREILSVTIGGAARSINSFVNEDQRQIISIVERFSASIKRLKFFNVTLDESTFLEILSLTPNIEHLDLRSLHFNVEEQPSKRQCRDYDLNLRSLKSLALIACHVNIDELLVHLPAGALTKLKTRFCSWNGLAVLINRQLDIKELKFHFQEDNGIRMDICDNLKLESLDMIGNESNSVTIAAILSKQQKLKSLRLNGNVVDEGVMDAVADLLELETLAIDISRISVASFVKVRKLKNLLYFKLKNQLNENTAKLEALSKLDNISIRKLCLPGGSEMTVDLISALAKSAPHLTYIDFLAAPNDSRKVDAILWNFNFVEVLKIKIYPSETFVEPGNYFNPKLRELQVQGSGKYINPWLPKFIAAYPNIIKLNLSISLDYSSEIVTLLNGFPKLESLILSAHKLNIQDLDNLVDHKNNLNFVCLKGLEKDVLTDDFVKELRASFGVVNVERDIFERYELKCGHQKNVKNF